ncbi:nitroreductase family protein [Marinomonas communis]|uniref:Nitroreductase n=1 Tax=Marinomonas communis TaxID=28254 RepID=A0A4R6X2E6_9GAMM|nr:nitroreductase family protein [Marinomonas communis]TDR13075.1 nitroreductase [Marinomonas communis]
MLLKIENILRFVVYLLRYFPDYICDLINYVKHSNKKYKSIDTKTQSISKIVSLYHVIEKGLSMKKSRPGFGIDRINSLIYYLELFSDNNEISSSIQYKTAIIVLKKYHDFNLSQGVTIEKLSLFLEKNNLVDKEDSINGGTKKIKRISRKSSENLTFSEVVNIRSSVRFFNDEIVPENDVLEALSIAHKSPSSCNRQSYRLIRVPIEKVPEVLKIQGGANGYIENIHNLFIIGFDIESYQGVGDRYSGYVDSSIFGTTLMYAFTSLGYQTLILNWSKPYKKNLELRKVVKLKESINISFFLAVGNIDLETIVPFSNRLDIKDIYKDA